MEFALLFVALALFWKPSSGLHCFKCAPEETYSGDQQCSHFDGSDKFLVLCEHSTMCFKRQTTLRLANGMSSMSVERGCASQRLSGDQARINGRWQLVDTIYEVYEEACKEAPTDSDGPTQTLHCFCRGNLCNNSRYNIASYTLIVIALFVYYLR
ncbi:unnamed protein product [Danaus chrysippus]|uniref:(African queen) hypothetical protein n=1 Tax=Danaus chrysippus TaxID=151541 RepID=A0A8J2QBY9_9NEOP|nr:unnamed protein product [Danaus chrysippus]